MSEGMDRRKFLVGLGGAAITSGFTLESTHAQSTEAVTISEYQEVERALLEGRVHSSLLEAADIFIHIKFNTTTEEDTFTQIAPQLIARELPGKKYAYLDHMGAAFIIDEFQFSDSCKNAQRNINQESIPWIITVQDEDCQLKWRYWPSVKLET